MPRPVALATRPLGPLVNPLVGALVGRVQRWSVQSQQGSRRNAMTASTALAARRAERDDVETYLQAALESRRPAPVGVAHG